jgi:hypothetical protein
MLLAKRDDDGQDNILAEQKQSMDVHVSSDLPEEQSRQLMENSIGCAVPVQFAGNGDVWTFKT